MIQRFHFYSILLGMSKPVKAKSHQLARNRAFARKRKADRKRQLQHEKDVGALLGVKSESACRGVACLHEILDVYTILRRCLGEIESDEEANAVWNGYIGVVGELKAFIDKVHIADAEGGVEVTAEKKGEEVVKEEAVAAVVEEEEVVKEEKKGEDRDTVTVRDEEEVFETAEEYQKRFKEWETVGEDLVYDICGSRGVLHTTSDDEPDLEAQLEALDKEL